MYQTNSDMISGFFVIRMGERYEKYRKTST